MTNYHVSLLDSAKILPIVCEPDRRLHQPSAPVEQVDDGIRAMLHDMMLTMYASNGIGLTAVQVGIMQKLIVIDIDRISIPESFQAKLQANQSGEFGESQTDKGLLHGGEPLFMINAEVLEFSQETQEYREGCLSIPYVEEDVRRPSRIKVRYLDYHGHQQERSFGPGLLSTCIQHEIDHSNGIVYWDRVSHLKRERLQKKMQKLLKRSKSN